MQFLIASLIVIFVWYLVSYYKWWKNIYIPIAKIPGPLRLPIVGTQYLFIGVPKEDLTVVLKYLMYKFRPLFHLWAGSIPEVLIMKPEHLEIVLNNSVHIHKGVIYNDIRSWLGQGLLTSTGPKWFQHRKLITPTFYFKILENFLPIFVEKTEMFLKILDTKANKGRVNVYTDITHCTLDIICETAMGVKVNAMSNEDNEYTESIYGMTEILFWKILHPYIPHFIFKLLPQGRRFTKDLLTLHGFSNQVIRDRKKFLKRKKSIGSLDKNGQDVDDLGIKRKQSFLDLLLEASENGRILSDTDIREEVDTFMFAGHDTVTAAISWALLLLGNHPEIQENAYQEIRYVLQGKSTPTIIAELNELKYLECIIKESLRMFPSVGLISRHLLHEIQIDSYKIPANTQIVSSIYGVHRSPEHYPDPDKFDPDRFLPENCVDRHPYAYIPFSAGPRNCIGQRFAMYEEKCILASIINRYKFTSVHKIEDVKASVDLIFRPHGGVFVEIEMR